MNEGQHRAMIVTGGRQIDGLHLCDNCAAVAMRAWPTEGIKHGVRITATPWRGTCDLCRFTSTLADMLNGR